MAERKHTPGPWAKVGLEVRMAHPLCKDSAIATVHLEGVDGNCGRANAALIAAAPDLLTIAKRLLEIEPYRAGSEDEIVELAKDALTAIAKATRTEDQDRATRAITGLS